MSISFEFSEGSRGDSELTHTWSFGDDVPVIQLGRDPRQCQVSLLSNATTFGRQHCRLVLQSGRYALETDSIHRVFWNDQEVFSGQTLAGEGSLRLGAEGPTLFARIVSSDELPPTDQSALGEHPAITARRADSQNKRGLWIGAAAISILAICGVVAFWSTKGSLKGLERQIAKVEIDVKEGQQLALDLAAAAARQPLPPNWAKIFDKSSPSVGLVMIRDAEGNVLPCATAWSVDDKRRQFATNSHVGKLLDELSSGSKLIVRMAGSDAIDFEVVSATIHPGYDAFTQVWENYAPATPNHSPLELINAAGPAYDVALLQTRDNGKAFPAALPIADANTLESLRAGQPLGSIGFPLEGLALGGVNAKAPVPIRHQAYIAANTDYFGGPGDAQRTRHLVQHALPSTGGASGSPILNDQGEVVAIHNAGNVIGSVNGVRVESSAMIFFSQRADLLRELLEDRATALQSERVAEWMKSLSTEFAPAARELKKDYLTQAKDRSRASFESGELVDCKISDSIPLQRAPVEETDASNGVLGRWAFTAPRSARYLAFAATENMNGAISIDVESSRNVDINPSGSRGAGNWFVDSTLMAIEGDLITLEIQGDVGDFPVSLEVFAVEPDEFEAGVLSERRVENWALTNDSEAIETIFDQRCELKKKGPLNFGSIEIELAKTGNYLCIVIPERFDAVKVEVRKSTDAADEPATTESRIGVSTWVGFEGAEAEKYLIDVSALSCEACQIRVMRVKKPPTAGELDP